MDNNVQIYTDGACSGNPGPGGWGVVILHDNCITEFAGGADNTTNNQMELMAVIEGLKWVTAYYQKSINVDVYSDSAYVVNAFNQNWIDGWLRNGWVNSKKQPVANQELWQELLIFTSTHQVWFHKVKGHAANPHNNRADQLAVKSIVRK